MKHQYKILPGDIVKITDYELFTMITSELKVFDVIGYPERTSSFRIAEYADIVDMKKHITGHIKNGVICIIVAAQKSISDGLMYYYLMTLGSDTPVLGWSRAGGRMLKIHRE